MNLKAIIFDWNGTLNDMRVVLEQDKHVGRVEFDLDLTDDDVIACWGRPAAEFFPMLFGRNGDRRSWQEMRRVFQRYDKQFARRLAPGARLCLTTLRRKQLLVGIVTAGQRTKVLDYMRQAGLAPEEFLFVHTDREVAALAATQQPALAGAVAELDGQDITPQEILVVGDEVNNMHDAEAVGCHFVIVASGTSSSEYLLQRGVPADRLVEDMDALQSLLSEL